MSEVEFWGAQRLIPVGGGFSLPDHWVWDGSAIVGDDGRYHLFASRWSRDFTMHPGWILKSEIVRAVAERIEGPYTLEEVVLAERGAEFWDGRAVFNACIRRHENTYILFYTGTTYPFQPITPQNSTTEDHKYVVAQVNKRIGVATARSIFGPWTRFDHPILPTRPRHFDNLLTSNPAPWVHDDGSVLLVYKTRSYSNGPGIWTPQKLGVARADHYLGPYQQVVNQPLFAGANEIEDPHIWQQGGRYRMVAKDMTGAICGERYAGVGAWSIDGAVWTQAASSKVYSRTVQWDDGHVQTLGCFDRPFVFLEDGKPSHLFGATCDGPGGFGRAEKTWITVVPLAPNSRERHQDESLAL